MKLDLFETDYNSFIIIDLKITKSELFHNQSELYPNIVLERSITVTIEHFQVERVKLIFTEIHKKPKIIKCLTKLKLTTKGLILNISLRMTI